MCGIGGYTGEGSERSRREALEKMISSMVHRGPDESGYWIGSSVSLGMRRLAIVDLKSGQQPASNNDGSIKVVFNGEIYNHVELRKDLEKIGYQFKSDHSDTEVIPHLYEHEGISFLEKLNGMFAIAIWDERKQELILARDRCGIKPMFYSFLNEQLIFGSEIKVLLNHPEMKRAPNFEALWSYFSYKNTPAPLSAFAGIEQLKPGEYLVFSKGKIRKYRWWQLPWNETLDLSEAEASQEIRRLLEDSVRLQMRSDVPVGAYLSGGVDSSSVVALMSQVGAKNVKTFTLAYEDGFANKNSDRHFAEVVSKQYQTDHHIHLMSSQEVSDLMPQVIRSFDEPFSGTVSTFFLTKLIGQHVKVSLSGDGADEMFGSYLSHRLAGPLALLDRCQGDVSRLSIAEKQWLAPYENDLETLLQYWKVGTESQRREKLFVWSQSEKQQLLTGDFASFVVDDPVSQNTQDFYNSLKTKDPLNRALAFDFEHLLADQVLPFVDRLSMAHSVEVRPPFLDHRLVEFVAKLPGTMKIKKGRVKSILKDSVKDLLPADLLDRPKEGFVLPVNQWLAGSLKQYTEELLSEKALKETGIFNVPYARSIVENHQSGAKLEPNKVWNLMMFQLWWKNYFL